MDMVNRPGEADARLAADLARATRALEEEEAALAALLDALAAFERRYFAAFGAAYRELDELDARIAEAAARLKPDDHGKRSKAARLRARAEGRDLALPDAPEDDKPEPDDELRQAYRALARKVHPDLAADAADRAHREVLMVRVNQAYAAGDAALLAYLASGLALDGPAPDRAERHLESVRERLRHARGRRAAAEASGLARLMRRDRNLAEEGGDLFRKLKAELDETLQEARKRLRALERRLAKK